MSTHTGLDATRAAVEAVPDPEIPVLTIADLGIVRDVEADGDQRVIITITPTYSGCPALDVIRVAVEDTARHLGWVDVVVRVELSPAWTTDWMTPAGRRKLREYGIDPPSPRAGSDLVPLAIRARCPRCGSDGTRRISSFGATPCQAPFVCENCAEPFDKFKEI